MKLAALAVVAGLAVFSPALRAEEVRGEQVRQRTDRVMSAYRWTRSLEELRERAAREKKPIFWLQLVGELNGGL